MIPTTQTTGRVPAAPGIRVPGALGGKTAPLTGNALHDAVRRIAGKMQTGTPTAAPPSALEQAQQVVSSTLTPLEQQLIAGYTGQGAAGAQAIRALTAQYAAQMGQEPSVMSGIYGTAEQSNAASNDALANRLSGAGTGASDELAQRLASIQQPGAVNPVISQLAGNATGSGNALYAGGNAALEQLIGQGANAQTYAAKLPGIAKETGIQSLGQYEGQIGTAESQALSTLESKAPGLVQQAFGTITEGNQAAAALTAKKTQNGIVNALKAQGLSDTEAKTRASIIIATNLDPTTGGLTAAGQQQLAALGITGTGVAGSAGATVVHDNTTTALTQERLTEQQLHDRVVEGQGATKIRIAQEKVTLGAQPKLNASVSRALGYAADQYGNPVGKTLTLLPGNTIGPDGNIVKSSTSTAGKVNGFTPTQVAKLRGQALTGAQAFFKGWKDKQGPHPPDTYEQAMLAGQQQGIPLWVLIPALNRFYAPGVQGRPSKAIHIGPTGSLGIQIDSPGIAAG